MRFNDYLKSCREQNKLTQEQLVQALYNYDIEHFGGLDVGTLGKWERGLTKPKASRQVSILKYFQKITGTAMPCWSGFSVDEAEELICKAGMHNLIGKRKQLILDFPSDMIRVDDMCLFLLRSSEKIDALIDVNMPLHQSFNHTFTQIGREQFKAWSLHPGSLFLVCEYKDNFMGLLFTIRLKPEIFEKVLHFEMKKSEITVDDFAAPDEMGSNLLLSFFAMNDKAATMLLVRYYAYLIANQKYMAEIGVVTVSEDAKKIVCNMNLHYDTSTMTEDNVEIQSYRETLSNALASENVVKMILSKQECPEV